MNKEASLIKLNSVIIELENNGYFQEADELHELYIKLAASKPWYKSPLIMAPALMGSMAIPGRSLVDYISNRELYQATRNLEPFQHKDQSNTILLWKKFLNTQQEEGHSFLPMNGVFDNITQIRTNEFAQKNDLPHTPGQLDKTLIEATFKQFPNNPILTSLVNSLRTTERSQYLLPSEEPFSTDILSQLDYDARDEYLKRYGLNPDDYQQQIEQKTITQQPIEQELPEQKPTLRKPSIKPIVKKPTKKVTKTENTYGVFDSPKQGIPFDTSDLEVYKIFKHIRNKYEGRISTDIHDTGNRNPNNVPGGGGTKYGITQGVWDSYSRRHKMKLSPVLEITREQAEQVSFENYKFSGAHLLPPNTQIAIADFNFNGGPVNMIIAVRKVLGLPPIQVQGLTKKQKTILVREQKKILYPMLQKLIKNQEDDEKYARLIYSARVELLAGSKTGKKKKQLVHNRGLLNRINEMAEITGNDTVLDEVSAQLKDQTDEERLETLKKYRLNRSRYYYPGYGNSAFDKKVRQQSQKDT